MNAPNYVSRSVFHNFSIEKVLMPTLTERDAETLSTEQATALLRLLNLHARWEGLLSLRSEHPQSLHAKQRANDAFQAALRAYTEKYRTTKIPEPTQAAPERLGVWCRTLRVLFQKADGVSPVELLGRAYRLADRIAARLAKETIKERPGEALLALDRIIDWCDVLAIPAPLFKPKKDQAA